ncbi:hypothetical protein EMIT040CA3_80019 [Bacillus pseudomycoides]
MWLFDIYIRYINLNVSYVIAFEPVRVGVQSRQNDKEGIVWMDNNFYFWILSSRCLKIGRNQRVFFQKLLR